MRMSRIDLQAEITVLPFEKSGRSVDNDMKIDVYFPTFKLHNRLNDVFLNHPSRSFLKSQDHTEIGIQFKFPSLQIGRLTKGDEFELTEGSRTTIKGEITQIINPILSKTLWELNLSKSIEELEKDKWEKLNDYPSTMVEKCHELRRIQMSDLSNEQLRFSLSQDVGIKHTVPLIIEKLIKDKFIECDFYPGDLLVAVFRKLNVDWGTANFLKDEITFFVRQTFLEIKLNEDIPEKVKREIFDEMENYENTRDSLR